jgi:hypothetical protein
LVDDVGIGIGIGVEDPCCAFVHKQFVEWPLSRWLDYQRLGERCSVGGWSMTSESESESESTLVWWLITQAWYRWLIVNRGAWYYW